MLNISIIKSLSKPLWYDTKKILEHKINQVKGFKRAAIRRFDNYIEVSGKITFRFEDDCEVVLWNTCSRHSGGEVTLSDLNKVQELVREWWTEEME